MMMNDVNISSDSCQVVQMTFCESERVLDAQYTIVIAHVLVVLYMREIITSWLSSICLFLNTRRAEKQRKGRHNEGRVQAHGRKACTKLMYG